MTDVTSSSYYPVKEYVLLPLQGPASAMSSSLLVVPVGWSTTKDHTRVLAKCELGLAAPRGGAFKNEALPPLHSRAFCHIQSPLPLPAGGGVSGGFIASPTDRGLRIRGRVCGFPPGMSGVPLRLHAYGDLGDGTLVRRALINDGRVRYMQVRVCRQDSDNFVSQAGLLNVGSVAFDMGAMVIDNLGSANFDLIDEPVSVSNAAPLNQ